MGLFQKPSANSLFPDNVQLPQQRPEIPAMPGQVPVNFQQWQADPVNLIKIGQDPQQASPFRTAQQQLRPEPPPDVAPVAPNPDLPQAPMPAVAAPSQAPAFDASGIMPKRPEQPQLSRGQNIGMALATVADNIGAALSHGQASVGANRLKHIQNTQELQQQYDQNAPKLQYDLKQKVTSDALGNAATAAGTAHTRQVTQNLQGQPSPEQARKAQFMDEWSKNAEGGKYSPDALKAAVKRAAQYHNVAMSDGEIDSLAGVKPLGPAFKVNDEGGYPVSVVRRDGTTLPANSKDLTAEELQAVGGYNSAITDKENRQNARDDKRSAESDARLNKTLAASLARQNDKPASEGERNAFSFYKRGSDAEKVLTELEPKIAALGLAGQMGRTMLPNVMQSDDNQVYTQAQRQFTQAKLRRESGAAISQAEYDQDAKTYFPSPGDSPAVLKRKSDARQAVLKELQVASGKAYTQSFGDESKGGNDVVEYERVNGKLVPKAAKK